MGPLLPTLDTFLFAIPILVLLAMGMLGLDERFARQGGGPQRRRACGPCDPDGKPWPGMAPWQIEGRIIHNPGSGAKESMLEDGRVQGR